MLSQTAVNHLDRLMVYQLAERYRDYLSNFRGPDVRAWAHEYNLDIEDAESFLKLCRAAHNAGF